MYNIVISILICITFDRLVMYTVFKQIKNISRPQYIMHQLCYHFIIIYNNITTKKYVDKHRYDNIMDVIILHIA